MSATESNMIRQLELALEISGTELRPNNDGAVDKNDVLLRADTLIRLAGDPGEAALALLGMDFLFKMAITRMAGDSGRGYQEVLDEMLTHARSVLEHARAL